MVKGAELEESSNKCMGIRGREEEIDIERMKVNNKAPKNDRPRLIELEINDSTKGAKQQEEVGKRKKGM